MNHEYQIIQLTVEQAKLPQDHLFSRLTLASTAIGLFCLVTAFLLGRSNIDYFFFSFHVWWLFFLSIAIGAVFFVLIQFVTKAAWSVVVRRLAENISLTMPLFLVLFVVMAFGTKILYSAWTSPIALQDPIIAAKHWYLNIPFFYIRGLLYLVIFSIAAIFFAKNSEKQDKSGKHALTYRMQTASIPFLIILGFCVTFASFDWIMSLSPKWYSTIFGLYFFAGCYMAFIATLTIATRLTHDIKSLKKIITMEHYHDLAKLIFAHSCFWAYAGFVQYLLIWYGNLPEETEWYALRQQHNWFYIWTFLCIGHFFVPFFFLLARKAKRSRNWICFVAIWMLFMQFLDIYWLVMPNKFKEGPVFGSIDIFSFLGIGGLFLAIFSAVTKRKSMIPIKDPRLPESLSYENV